jgi:hypothetical protein
MIKFFAYYKKFFDITLIGPDVLLLLFILSVLSKIKLVKIKPRYLATNKIRGQVDG